MASGEIIGCFGLTEPDAGSDPSSMKSLAKKVKGGYKIKGTKTWITNAPIADLLIIWAKDEEGKLRGFIVERQDKGLETPYLKGKFSLRASATGQIFMDDLFVPEDRVLPEVDSFRGPFSCLNMLGMEYLGGPWVQQSSVGMLRETTHSNVGNLAAR